MAFHKLQDGKFSAWESVQYTSDPSLEQESYCKRRENTIRVKQH